MRKTSANPMPSSNAASIETQRLEQAAHWLLRLREDQHCEAEFLDWLASDERNAAAYDAVDGAWSSPALSRADAKTRRLLLGQERKLPTRSLALGLALCIAVGGAVGIQSQSHDRRYEAGGGRIEFVRLDDGSSLYLDARSVAEVHYSLFGRSVELQRGSALVDVEHEWWRKFTVSSKGLAVRALGTRYSVTQMVDGQRMSVYRGRVGVSAARGDLEQSLDAGKTLLINAEGRTEERELGARSSPDWMRGRIELDGDSLEQAIAEFNRYSRERIVLADPALRRIPLSGGFDAHDTAAFLKAVETITGAQVRHEAAGGWRIGG